MLQAVLKKAKTQYYVRVIIHVGDGHDDTNQAQSRYKYSSGATKNL